MGAFLFHAKTIHIQASDGDDGAFGDVTYTLSGFGAGDRYVLKFLGSRFQYQSALFDPLLHHAELVWIPPLVTSLWR